MKKETVNINEIKFKQIKGSNVLFSMCAKITVISTWPQINPYPIDTGAKHTLFSLTSSLYLSFTLTSES